MAGSLCIAIPAFPHAVIQRDNNHQAIFLPIRTVAILTGAMQQAKSKCNCRIFPYELMIKHFHFLVEPAEFGKRHNAAASSGRRDFRNKFRQQLFGG